MPKKFAGENSKAVAARARKEAAKDADKGKKKQADEEAKWQDDDKNIVKKQQKKEEQERKKQEQLQKKAEAKALLEQEMSSLTKSSAKAPPAPKVTRAQIETRTVAVPKKEEKKLETHLDKPLEVNINRESLDEEQARNIAEAISILSTSEAAVDKHPEKRLKAAFTAYETHRLKELTSENPKLRLSQLKQMIFKEWQKSPENPLNKIQ